MLNRRNALMIGMGSLALASTQPFHQTVGTTSRTIYGGWVFLEECRQEFIRAHRERAFFSAFRQAIAGTGQNTQVLLWKAFEKITGAEFEPHLQDIGDCTGQAMGLGVDTLTTTQIALQGRPEQWKGKCSTEYIYAGARIEIGKGAACFNRYGRPLDGAMGVWVAKMVLDYGVLLRGEYGKYDLRTYNPNLARQWAYSNRAGVPDELEPVGKAHPVKTISLIESWDQACDSVANGYPVILCSNVGFFTDTDNDGFLHPGPRWDHAMLLWAIDSLSKRQGGCIANSWGRRWMNNRRRHKLGCPAGCFWADAKVIDRMLKQGDSYAISQYVGYPRQQLDYRLY